MLYNEYMKTVTTHEELKHLKQSVIHQSFYKVWEPEINECPLHMRVYINLDFYDDQSFARVEKWDDKNGWLLIVNVGISQLENIKLIGTQFPIDNKSIAYIEKHQKASVAATQDAKNLLEIALRIIK